MASSVLGRTLRGPGLILSAWHARRREERWRRLEGVYARLEDEVKLDLEPLLGAAGLPQEPVTRRAWRRSQVDAYLARPPWRRVWSAWRSWGFAHRAAVALLLAALWTAAVLPFRIVGLASTDVSENGFAVLLVVALIAPILPPWRTPRFAAPVERAGVPWWTTGAARAALAACWCVAGLTAGALVVTGAASGVADPSPGPPSERGLRTDRRIVGETVARACPGAEVTAVTWLGGDRYAARVAGGGSATVRVLWRGRAAVGTGAGRGAMLGAPPPCAAG